jgi:hypothetical protein
MAFDIFTISTVSMTCQHVQTSHTETAPHRLTRAKAHRLGIIQWRIQYSTHGRRSDEFLLFMLPCQGQDLIGRLYLAKCMPFQWPWTLKVNGHRSKRAGNRKEGGVKIYRGGQIHRHRALDQAWPHKDKERSLLDCTSWKAKKPYVLKTVTKTKGTRVVRPTHQVYTARTPL